MNRPLLIKNIFAYSIDVFIVHIVTLNVGAIWLYICSLQKLLGLSPLPSASIPIVLLWIGIALVITCLWSYFTIKSSIGKYLLALTKRKRNIPWFVKTAFTDLFICFVLLVSLLFFFYRDVFLTYATIAESPRAVSLLLKLGTNPNVKIFLDKKQVTLPIISAENLEILKLILDKGGDPNAEDDKGKTVLMYVTEIGLIEQVKLLVLAGADKTKKDNEGNTALDYALKKGLNSFRQYLE